ncbi:hypothetical protein [Desulfovulcanus sp.]
MTNKHDLVQELIDSWFKRGGSPLVKRSEVKQFCSMLHPRTLANHDSQGTGPKPKIRMGRNVAYPVKALAIWCADKINFES